MTFVHLSKTGVVEVVFTGEHVKPEFTPLNFNIGSILRCLSF